MAHSHHSQPRQLPATENKVQEQPISKLPGSVQAAVQPLKHCRKSELGLQKKSTPPVRELSVSKAFFALEKMQKNINAYCANSSAITKNTADTRFLSAGRLQSTNKILNLFRSKLRNAPSSERVYFGYFVAGQPVGLLLMDSSEISCLLTHPGSECVGGILIEQAVQKSQKKKGSNGKVKLCALDDAAQKAYTALGFVKEEGADADYYLSLDPANKPHIWTKNSQGQYCLRKYMNQGYIG